MSVELYPYVRPLTISRLGGVGLPGNHFRKEEMLGFLRNQILVAIESYEIDDIVDVGTCADLLFDELTAKKVLREEVQKYAGSYWRINSAQMKLFANDFPKNDSVSKSAARIGERFYPDVFDGYRTETGAFAGDTDALIPRSTIAAQDWSSISKAISENDKQDIRAKVDDLVDTIKQSDLEDHLKINALKRAESVALLLEAPDPPWEVVVDLLNNRYLQAFLSAITIAQLIIGMAS